MIEAMKLVTLANDDILSAWFHHADSTESWFSLAIHPYHPLLLVGPLDGI